MKINVNPELIFDYWPCLAYNYKALDIAERRAAGLSGAPETEKQYQLKPALCLVLFLSLHRSTRLDRRRRGWPSIGSGRPASREGGIFPPFQSLKMNNY